MLCIKPNNPPVNQSEKHERILQTFTVNNSYLEANPIIR